MANRFEQPIDSQFMNTYVPIPFDAMMKAGQMKQQRYDATAAAIDQSIARAEMINAIPNSIDEQYKKEALQKIYDIRDQYVGKDLSDPFVYRQLNNDITKGIDKNRIQKMEQSFTSWGEAQKIKKQLAAAGKWNPLLDEDPANRWDSTTGVYDYTPGAYIDKAELFRPYYQDLKPESDIVDYKGYKAVRTGVSDSKVKAVTERAAQELVSTPQGQQQIKLYKALHPDADLSSVESQVKVLRDQMYDYGKQFVSSDYQVLSANLQDDYAGGTKPKMPTRFNLFYASPGEVTNFNKVRDVEKEIERLKGIPGREQAAADLQVQLDDLNKTKGAVVKQTVTKNENDILDRLINTGKFADRNQASTFMKSVMNSYAFHKENMKPREFAEWGANNFNALVGGVEDVLNIAGSGLMTLFSKDFLKGKEKFGDIYKEWRSQAPDLMNKVGTAGDRRKQTDPISIVLSGVEKASNEVDKVETDHDNLALKGPEGMSKTVQYQNVLHIPTLNTEDLAFVPNATGDKRDVSKIANYLKALPAKPEAYKILSVDGKRRGDINGNRWKSMEETFKNNDYDVEWISPQLKLDPENGYAPVIDVTYKSKKATDVDTKDFRKQVKVAITDPSEIGGLVEDLWKTGNYEAAYFMQHPDIAMKVDSENFDRPNGVDLAYKFEDGSLDNINVKGSGNKFTISYIGPNDKKIVIPVSSRDELKNELYNLALQYAGPSFTGRFSF